MIVVDMTMPVVMTPINLRQTPGCRLWIDGVGCWLLWWAAELTIGNGSPVKAGRFRFRIMSDLHPQHGTWKRHEGANWFQPQAGVTRLNSHVIHCESPLRSGDVLRLGDSVLLNWSQPCPLSPSPVFTIGSSHRNCDHLDGVVLFDQTCLLGPSIHNHIQCRHWEERVVLFDHEGELWWRVDQPGRLPQPVHPGEILVPNNWRLRVEVF